MKLNTLKISGKHPTWCGPSALSIITGRTVNYCAKLIAGQRNQQGYWHRGKGTSKQVKGAYNSEMRRALNTMGFEMKRVDMPRPKQTLHRYMRERGGEQWKGVMLVNVTSHYVVVNRDTVSDNHQQDKHYTDHKHRLKKIDKAWLITRKR